MFWVGMKLRLRNNSVRLRLTKGEVAYLAETGAVEEAIEFGTGIDERLIYALVSVDDAVAMHASIEGERVTIFVPEEEISEWAATDRIGIEAEYPIGGGKILRILVEKDFRCLEPRTGGDDADTFSHPRSAK
jgi:hypothetical protein